MHLEFYDNHILVAVKPAGIATQPEFHEMAREWIQREFNKPGKAFCEPIHRLDKPVQGLVLFARTSKALSRLQAAMRERRIEKTYVARVEGFVEEGRLEHFLVHGSHRAHVVKSGGKRASLSFTVIDRDADTTLVKINLETGRYHQIRAQFAHIGHPIVGDEKYGAKPGKFQLFATELSFEHPISKDRVIISSAI